MLRDELVANISTPSTFPVTVIFPVTPSVLPSNVKLASPFKLLASIAVTSLLLTPFVKSASVLPQTLESISSVPNVPSASNTITELSTPVPIFGAVIVLLIPSEPVSVVFPSTANVAFGFVVPIPIQPFASIVKLLVATEFVIPKLSLESCAIMYAVSVLSVSTIPTLESLDSNFAVKSVVPV